MNQTIDVKIDWGHHKGVERQCGSQADHHLVRHIARHSEAGSKQNGAVATPGALGLRSIDDVVTST